MKTTLRSISKQFKYDLIIFFREPFFALPILLLPGLFFIIYAGSMIKQTTDTAYFAQYLPMYMILISFLTLFFNIGTQYVTDKEGGIFKRMILSPISIYNLVLTYAMRGTLISILGFIEMILIAKILFKIPLSNNMFMFLVAFIIIVGIMMLISLAFHGFFKNSRQVMPFTIIGFQYVLFASGMIMPVESMPKIMRYLVYINPIYHMNLILTDVWYEKTLNITNILALVVCVIICFVILKFQKGFTTDK